MWYTQEFGYNVGTKITEDLSGGLLQKVTKGASILGMFVLGALIERWVSINFTPVVSKVTLSKGAYIDWAKLPAGAEGIKTALTPWIALSSTGAPFALSSSRASVTPITGDATYGCVLKNSR